MHSAKYQQYTIPADIRGWLDPLFRELYSTTYISVVSLGPPNVVVTRSPCIDNSNTSTTSNRVIKRKRKRDNVCTSKEVLTDSPLLCKNPAYLYRSANEQLALQRLSRRLSQVCENVWIHACQCVYANAARGFTLRRVSHILPISDRKRRCIRPLASILRGKTSFSRVFFTSFKKKTRNFPWWITACLRAENGFKPVFWTTLKRRLKTLFRALNSLSTSY